MSAFPAQSKSAPSAAARLFATFLVARAAFGLMYLAVTLGRLPVPWYRPLEHRWELAQKPAGFAMGWFGTTAAALFVAILVSSVVWLLSKRGTFARALAKTSIVLALAHTGALVLVVDYAYFGWTLTHQKPKPLRKPKCMVPPP